MSEATPLAAALWPYVIVVVVGFLPSEMWRMLGVLLSRGLDEKSEVIVWVRLVATTLLAGVVAKLLFFPTGALALVPAYGRVGALLAGLGAYYGLGRSVIAGVVVGEVALIAVAAIAVP